MAIQKNKQVQNIPIDLQKDDPDIIPKLIDVTKQTLRKITELSEIVMNLKEKVQPKTRRGGYG